MSQPDDQAISQALAELSDAAGGLRSHLATDAEPGSPDIVFAAACGIDALVQRVQGEFNRLDTTSQSIGIGKNGNAEPITAANIETAHLADESHNAAEAARMVVAVLGMGGSGEEDADELLQIVRAAGKLARDATARAERVEKLASQVNEANSVADSHHQPIPGDLPMSEASSIPDRDDARKQSNVNASAEPHFIDLEDTIRQTRGQAHAMLSAMEHDHPSDPLVYAAEALAFRLDQLNEQFQSLTRTPRG